VNAGLRAYCYGRSTRNGSKEALLMERAENVHMLLQKVSCVGNVTRQTQRYKRACICRDGTDYDANVSVETFAS
jgi:hypothetical protein